MAFNGLSGARERLDSCNIDSEPFLIPQEVFRIGASSGPGKPSSPDFRHFADPQHENSHSRDVISIESI